VLVVDDDRDILESLRDLIESSIPGVQVETASNGATALEMVRDHGLCALVTDYRMPGMNGIDLAAAAHRLKPRLPIFLITAFRSEDMAASAATAGVDALIHKPLDPEALVSTILSGMDAGVGQEAA
jgi:DNA-binding NtrC family response regulator